MIECRSLERIRWQCLRQDISRTLRFLATTFRSACQDHQMARTHAGVDFICLHRCSSLPSTPQYQTFPPYFLNITRCSQTARLKHRNQTAFVLPIGDCPHLTASAYLSLLDPCAAWTKAMWGLLESPWKAGGCHFLRYFLSYLTPRSSQLLGDRAELHESS